jgi:solute carrier family 25 phosphate transporter 3
MHPLFPSQGTLHGVFPQAIPFGRHPESPKKQPEISRKPTPLQARPELYTAWSVVDDAKDKANALSAEAAKEFEKATGKGPGKAGGIELYSANYYAACAFGGLLACVSTVKTAVPGLAIRGLAL